ncbi:MAG: DUF397 domain-containing protein [Pseudonocardia sp.]
MNSIQISAVERSRFRKAKRSGQDPQSCVEVARGHAWVMIRDSKKEWLSADDHRLIFASAQFDAWRDAQGGADAAEAHCIEIVPQGDGTHVFRSTVPQDHNHVLIFTDAEISAFLDGVRNGEFTEFELAEV